LVFFYKLFILPIQIHFLCDALINNQAEKKFQNKLEALNRKRDYEVENGLREKQNKIGGYYRYGKKTTAAAASLLMANAVILKQGIWTYLYFIGLVKIIRDTVKEAYTGKGFKKNRLKPSALVYYLAAASVIVVAAATSNHVVPGFESELGNFLSQVMD